MHAAPIYDLAMSSIPHVGTMTNDRCRRGAVATAMGLAFVLLEGGCASVSSPAAAPAGRVASLTLRSTLVHGESGDGARNTVMSEINVIDSAGGVLAAPRMLTALGSPGSIRIGTEREFIEVLVTSRREGSAVVVTATCSEDGGPPRIEARAEAR